MPGTTSRRGFLKATAAGAAGLSTVFSGCSPASETAGETAGSTGKPNIVLIMADDLGYECIGCYGGTSYRTPRIDELARTGIRFNHAYAQPLCTPTRLQIMTGLYNHRNWTAFGLLDPGEKTFGHHMKQAGYKTCISGKWQLYSYNPPDYMPEWRGKGMDPKDAGFDEHFLWHTGHTEDKGSRYADPVVADNGKLKTFEGQYGPEVYTDYIKGFMERHRDEPFFVYYPMALPHGPFLPTPHSDVWESGDRHKGDVRFYGDMVEYMDTVVGRIVDKLEELGLREKTLVLYYSDNGTPRQVESKMGGRVVLGGKGLTTDAGTRVPLIANWPGTIASAVTDDLVDSTDFIPTMLEVAGAPAPEGFRPDGQSFLPRLRGEAGRGREWVFCHYDPRPGIDKEQYTLLRFARDQRFKLYDDGKLFDVPNDVLEERPLAEDAGDPEAAAARQKLQPVLDQMKV